jgi:hypothetical protein
MEYQFSKNFSELRKLAEQERLGAIRSAEEQYYKSIVEITEKYNKLRSESLLKSPHTFNRKNSALTHQEETEKTSAELVRRKAISTADQKYTTTIKEINAQYDLEVTASKISDAKFNIAADWGRSSVQLEEERLYGDIKHELDAKEAEWRRQNPKAQ